MTDDEYVVLVDDSGRPSGTAPKRLVHHATTPLHLAFSCWVFDRDGRTLLTRRARSKQTWPGAWTNTVCGHPAPGEKTVDAVRRRAHHELGMALQTVDLVLPDFRYRAVMTDGTVENEVCPVYVARPASNLLTPDPTEVDDLRWATLDDVSELTTDDPSSCSPWMILQLPHLVDLPLVREHTG